MRENGSEQFIVRIAIGWNLAVTAWSCLAACGNSDPGPGACASSASALVWSRVAGSPAGFAISGSGPNDLWILAGQENGANYVMRGARDAGGPPDTESGVSVLWTKPAGTAPVDAGNAGCLVENACIGNGRLDAYGNPGVGGGSTLWVGGADSAFTAAGVVHRWNGQWWMTYNINDNREVQYLWGSGANDVWGVGLNYVGHWDGVGWTHVDSVHSGPIAGGGSQDWWVPVYVCKGRTPSPENPGCDANVATCTWFQHHLATGVYEAPVELPGCSGSVPYAAWASAADDIWFVGDGAFHYNGTTWSVVPTPSRRSLRGIWGTSRTDVWAVGDGGVIIHFDGDKWTSVASPTQQNLEAVWASSPCDVWAIGDAVYHAGASTADPASAMLKDSGRDATVETVSDGQGSGPELADAQTDAVPGSCLGVCASATFGCARSYQAADCYQHTCCELPDEGGPAVLDGSCPTGCTSPDQFDCPGTWYRSTTCPLHGGLCCGPLAGDGG